MKRWVLVLALGGVAAAALWQWFPQQDDAATVWRYGMDRDQVIARARAIAAEFGVQAGGWQTGVISASSNLARETWKAFPASPVRDLIAPATVRIGARRSDTGEAVTLSLDSAGRLVRFTHTGSPAPATGMTDTARAVEALALGHAGRFTLRNRTSNADGRVAEVWDWTDPATRLSATIRVESRNGMITSAGRDVNPPDEFAQAVRERRLAANSVLAFGQIVLLWLGLPVAAGVFFWRLSRRRNHARLGVGIALLLIAPVALSWLMGREQDAALLRAIDENSGLWPALGLSALYQILLVSLWTLVYGAGIAVLVPGLRGSWVSLTLAARMRWNSRVLTGDALAGLLLAPVVAVCPYLLAALGAVPSASTEWLPASVAYQRFPWLGGLLAPAFSVDGCGVFAFLVPAAAALRGPAWLRWPIASSIAIALTAGARGFYRTSLGDELAGAAVLLVVYAFIFRVAGLFGLWWGLIGSAWLLQALAIPAHRTELLSAYAISAAVLAVWCRLAPEGAAQEAAGLLDPAREAQARSERERLLGEFSFARRAQQDMLPAEPPVVAGYEIAAHCQPAREVGGDFYDFRQLSDGRWLVCVADVSGKGVPAALFMTFTKGVLAAAARRYTRLEDIAAAVNRHFYRQAQRRWFVTMVLAALEESTGRVEILRAGHNPPLLVRNQESVWLQPPGMGLGLCGPGLFEVRCRCEEVTLAPGDSLLLYSDGLPEAMNTGRAHFGEDRVIQGAAAASAGARPLVSALMSEVSEFIGKAAPHDDITLVAIQAKTCQTV